jgi:hypothetical protein
VRCGSGACENATTVAVSCVASATDAAGIGAPPASGREGQRPLSRRLLLFHADRSVHSLGPSRRGVITVPRDVPGSLENTWLPEGVKKGTSGKKDLTSFFAIGKRKTRGCRIKRLDRLFCSVLTNSHLGHRLLSMPSVSGLEGHWENKLPRDIVSGSSGEGRRIPTVVSEGKRLQRIGESNFQRILTMPADAKTVRMSTGTESQIFYSNIHDRERRSRSVGRGSAFPTYPCPRGAQRRMKIWRACDRVPSAFSFGGCTRDA